VTLKNDLAVFFYLLTHVHTLNTDVKESKRKKKESNNMKKKLFNAFLRREEIA